MSKKEVTPKILGFSCELNKHFSDVIFDKKEDYDEPKTFTTEEQMVNFSNEVLGIQVMSLSLPNNYSPQPKTEVEVMAWLRDKIHNRHSFAYSISLKYG